MLQLLVLPAQTLQAGHILRHASPLQAGCQLQRMLLKQRNRLLQRRHLLGLLAGSLVWLLARLGGGAHCTRHSSGCHRGWQRARRFKQRARLQI